MPRKRQPTLDELKKLHAEHARRPDVDRKIAEADAEYERVKASGGLRRLAAPKRHRKAR
jgi:hypothetical protein